MNQEQYIEHEVKLRVHDERFRMMELLYKQLNKKLDIIMGACGAIFTVILIPILLHGLKLV